jgi:hypothetical protein
MTAVYRQHAIAMGSRHTSLFQSLKLGLLLLPIQSAKTYDKEGGRRNILSLLECDIIIVPVLSVLIVALEAENLLLFLLLLGCLFVGRSLTHGM